MHAPRNAFSLLEVVITLGFLAVLLLPISQLFIAPQQESLFQSQQAQALQVAQSLLEEISGKGFEDLHQLPHAPTSSFGWRDDANEITADRKTWDDLDDYANLVVTGNGMTANVAVTYINNVDTASAVLRTVTDNPTDFKEATVRVDFGRNMSVKLVRIFGSFYNE
jgi:type II secretory pathway pseudopilin PulG